MGLFISMSDIFLHQIQVYEFVGLKELYYAGSHGMDIVGPVRECFSLDDHPNCIRSTDTQVSSALSFTMHSLIYLLGM